MTSPFYMQYNLLVSQLLIERGFFMLKVVKANTLIEAKYKMGIEEQRLILYMVSLVEPQDEAFKEYEISVMDFSKMMNLTPKTQYNKFKQIGKNLTERGIWIKEGQKTIKLCWLASAAYDEGVGIIKLSFSPYLKPYLLQLKRNFTMYDLKNIMFLKSIYSIRLFELLKQYEKLSQRVFLLDELKNILCVENVKSYENYADLKKRIILVAQQELEEKCDICFTFEEIKEGKKVAKLKFFIHKNDGNKKTQATGLPQITAKEIEHDNVDDGIDEMDFIKETLSKKELRAIFKAAGGNIGLIRNRYEEAKKKKEIDNLVGFLIWSVKQPDETFKTVKSKRKSQFHNFEGRKIDFDEIERLEQEYIQDLLSGKAETDFI